ncbi:MAG: hypothetical protein ACRCT5_12895 [Tannerellaceae bacterium]
MQIYIRAGYSWRIANQEHSFFTASVHARSAAQADFVISCDGSVFTIVKSRLDKDLKNAVAFSYSDIIDAINMAYVGRCPLYTIEEPMYRPAYKAGKIVASYTFASADEVDELVNEIMKRNLR